MTNPTEQPSEVPQRRKPSRYWYVLSAALLLGSVALFVVTLVGKRAYVQDQVAPMPRFVAPTDDEGAVITVKAPGKQNIFYENRGGFEGKTYDTPRRQVWTTYESPSMTCEVTRVDTGEAVEVSVPGLNEKDERQRKSRTSADPVITYDIDGMQGHSLWVFDAEQAGEYRIKIRYVDAVRLDPKSITVPPELAKSDKKKMTSAQGAAHEAARRDALEKLSLAVLEPVDVLFAVGPDPLRGSLYEVIGLKGAAAALAFGFTFAVLITLVVFMLRNGHVTPRGEIEHVKRMGDKP